MIDGLHWSFMIQRIDVDETTQENVIFFALRSTSASFVLYTPELPKLDFDNGTAPFISVVANA